MFCDIRLALTIVPLEAVKREKFEGVVIGHVSSPSQGFSSWLSPDR